MPRLEARLFAVRLLDAVREDIPFWDVTTEAIPDVPVEAVVLFRERGVVAGLEEAVALAELLGVEARQLANEGDWVDAGTWVLLVRGSARDVLKLERTLLNIIMLASGIATATRRVVERARRANPNVRVAATRKTHPLLRYLEKRAVALGGGDPHRFSLSDAVLIKDTHIAVFGSLEAAIEAVRRMAPFTAKIEVEVSTVEDAVKAARLGADIVMLDNMAPGQVCEAHERLVAEGLRSRVVLEASGRINEENVELYARCVDVVSLGYITHSVRAVDVAMEVIRRG